MCMLAESCAANCQKGLVPGLHSVFDRSASGQDQQICCMAPVVRNQIRRANKLYLHLKIAMKDDYSNRERMTLCSNGPA